MKSWLERVFNVSIGSTYVGGLSGFLVDLMFFQISLMCNFSGSIEGGRCFIKSNVRLGHAVKWPLLITWSIFSRQG